MLPSRLVLLSFSLLLLLPDRLCLFFCLLVILVVLFDWWWLKGSMSSISGIKKYDVSSWFVDDDSALMICRSALSSSSWSSSFYAFLLLSLFWQWLLFYLHSCFLLVVFWLFSAVYVLLSFALCGCGCVFAQATALRTRFAIDSVYDVVYGPNLHQQVSLF